MFLKNKVLIFDLHETIINLRRPYPVLYQDFIQKFFGYDVDLKLIEKVLMNYKFEFDSEKLINDHIIAEKWSLYHCQIVKQLLPVDYPRAIKFGLTVNDAFNFNHKIFYCSCRSLLKKLSRRNILVLCTNGMKSVERVISFFRFDDIFDLIIIAGRDGLSKPDPEIISRIEVATKMSRRNFLIIGNSRNHDVELGLRSGVETCFLDNQGNGCNSATYIIKSIQELALINIYNTQFYERSSLRRFAG